MNLRSEVGPFLPEGIRRGDKIFLNEFCDQNKNK